ncbi:MAG: beta-ketoacyl-[acyl-carrier-protein] synthase family protein [Candidatus Omnitrophica bacterium]|nr:beta-ketoacyl-[acyl-carrier-protein] synthase family protein [Candidatus Omnitrophota bacterium]
MKRRVVITGLGAMTALGEGIEPLWKACLEGRSGIGFTDPQAAWNPVAAIIRDFDPEKFVTQRKSLKLMARDIQLAIAGATLAMQDAALHSTSFNHERAGVIIGSGVLNHELDELAAGVGPSLDGNGRLDLKKFGADGLGALFPLWMLKYLPNMPACHISILSDLEGPNNTLTTGASASLAAAGEAARIIERGAAEVMLAGGAESKVNPLGFSQYKMLGAVLESQKGEPEKIYRPFDEHSNGFVVGEGAAFLVLEEFEHAKKRGARIYAEILGFGSSSHSKKGRKVAMESALEDAGVSHRDLEYLQASGLGTAEEDSWEAAAAQEVLDGAGPHVSVSASKPVTGFTGFSSGAMDLLISTMALWHGTIPPVANFERPLGDWEFEIVKGKPLRKKMKVAMTNAFGFNGPSVSMVTAAYPGGKK